MQIPAAAVITAAELTEQAPVTAWPQRLALTAVVAAVIGLAVWGMARNWRKRIARQSWVVAPAMPADESEVLDRFSARYVASVATGDWLERIAADGLGMPGRAEIIVHGAGLLIEREGERPIYLPGALIEDVASARGMAQEVYERDGLVAITWRSGPGRITTGLRMAGAQDHTALIDAVRRIMRAGRDSQGKAEV